MENNKKKRGSNFTPSEKDILLEVIKRYQHIIENKETNAQMIIKKRKIWESVCQQYNAVAVSGSRTWQQLRHLYENLKQRSKKNIAKANRLQFYENTREIEKKASRDKKEINRTGGGVYKSTLTGQDEQILAMAGCQITPLSNPYDDAAVYFGDTENNTTQNEIDISPNITIMNTDLDDYDTNMANINCVKDKSQELCTGTTLIADDQEVTISKIKQNQTLTIDSTRKMKPMKVDIKQQYFKTKLRNARLENRYWINKNKMEVNKYKIEMQILKLRLKKLQSSKTQLT